MNSSRNKSSYLKKKKKSLWVGIERDRQIDKSATSKPSRPVIAGLSWTFSVQSWMYHPIGYCTETTEAWLIDRPAACGPCSMFSTFKMLRSFSINGPSVYLLSFHSGKSFFVLDREECGRGECGWVMENTTDSHSVSLGFAERIPSVVWENLRD